MFNELSVIGYVTKDPVLSVTPDKQLVVNLNIASKVWTKEKEYTIWINAAFWGRAAEYAKNNIEKGDLVHVVGTLMPDRETGNPRMFQRRDGTYGTSYEIKGRLITRVTKKSTENNDSFEEDNNLF